MIQFIIIAAFLGSSGTPAAAADPVEKEEKLICKQVANTGWRLQSEKVCKSAKDWDRRSKQTQKEYEDHGSYSGRSRCLGCD